MTTPHLLHDAGHCLRAAAPPVLLLGLLTALRIAGPAMGTLDRLLGLAWQAASLASALCLVTAVSWAATRPWRDRRAHRRLQNLRDLAAEPDRALVHIGTAIWATAAGQHAIVLNIATGTLHRVWLPETTVPVGAFVFLERSNGGVRVVDCMYARGVVGAHRYERLHASSRATLQCEDPEMQAGDLEAPSPLILEIEAFLRGSADCR